MFDFKPKTTAKPVRNHRVSLTCELETPTGKQHIELPFTVGVLGDFSGTSLKDPESYQAEQAPLASRQFIDVGRDQVNGVMQAVKPGLSFQVKNHLKEYQALSVELNFSSMADFSPASIVQQVPLLERLQRLRMELSDIRQSPDRVQRLQCLLKELQQQDPEVLEYLTSKGSNLS